MIAKFSTIIILCSCLTTSWAQRHIRKPEIGIAQELKNDSLLYANGYHYIVESIQTCISPMKITDAEFETYLEKFRKLKTSIYAVNIFIPGELKLVGPEVQEKKILDYARIVFTRCKKAGIKMIVWGSGGARRVPDGFDHAKAKEQFIDIAKKVASMAKEFDLIIALENLNSTETNFINTVADALAIVQAVDHPNLRLCVDIYHMLKENEPPAIIESTKKYLVHSDIAEKEKRAAPGVNGDDFRPYLKALHKVGFDKVIILECQWTNLPEQIKSARLVLQKQIDDVYGAK